jgi:hypothetical protein
MPGEPAKKTCQKFLAGMNQCVISYFILALHSFSSFGSTILAHPDRV